MDQVTDLQTGQLSPPQTAHAEDQHQLRVWPVTGGCQVFELPNGEDLAFAPSLSTASGEGLTTPG